MSTTTRGTTLHPEEAQELLAVLRKHQRLNKKWGRLVPDFKTVTPGLPRRPENTPEALAGKLLWLTPE
ncbi:hypothetical protein PHYBOEH_005406 [Phytophthora boehmeriae]|uniref:Uncharacterized protein n=1 Tax=Phytophthora boehmeriae TaxID=109152 RepID=A0A8T1WP61_9STRA|nr:hypothetical protein PHYBOEH_005406 [Phytophthora boehmeriae]